MPCNQSLSILNGHVFYSNVFASFLCNHLLEMIGDKYSVCKRNGSWSTYGPVCRKRMLKKKFSVIVLEINQNKTSFCTGTAGN